jgi:hypothetical protein
MYIPPFGYERKRSILQAQPLDDYIRTLTSYYNRHEKSVEPIEMKQETRNALDAVHSLAAKLLVVNVDSRIKLNALVPQVILTPSRPLINPLINYFK